MRERNIKISIVGGGVPFSFGGCEVDESEVSLKRGVDHLPHASSATRQRELSPTE